MITFLSSPKPFIGTAYTNQLNAVRSWLNVHPDAEVILYGETTGCVDACTSLGVKHVPRIGCSPSGVPYFDAIVSHAQKHAHYDTQIYLNCDILIGSGILDALKVVSFPEFLILGQRIDLPLGAKIPSDGDNWRVYLQTLTEIGAKLHHPSGMDYFIFPRGMWEGLRPLVIGRAGYDSALVSFCLKHTIPVIDATCVIAALHQYHDYSHVKGKENEIAAGIDAKSNQLIHEVTHSAPNVIDANWQILDGNLLPSNSRGDSLRQLEIDLRYHKNMVFLSYIVRAIWRLLTGLGIYKTQQITLSDVVEYVERK